jgi:putative oxidoreductase
MMNRTNWTDLLYTDAPAWSILVRLLVGLVVFLPEGIQKLIFPTFWERGGLPELAFRFPT